MSERPASAERPVPCFCFKRLLGPDEHEPGCPNRVAAERPSPPEPSDPEIKLADLWYAYGCGARDVRLNPTATTEQIERGCDGYVKMFLQERAAGAARPPEPTDPSDCVEWAEYRVVLDALIRARVPNGTTGALAMLDALILRSAGAARPPEPTEASDPRKLAHGTEADWLHSLGLFAEALDDLLVTEDLTDADLWEAAETILPALADCLKARHGFAVRGAARPGGADSQPHKCPICQGQGHLNRPPWVAGDQPTYMTSDVRTYPCGPCGGSGIIWRAAISGGALQETDPKGDPNVNT